MTTSPKWLEDSVFYQIYPQSFNDTNGDGIGDIQGIIDKLDYIKWLGIDAIWINPCFESPFDDAGYDVADYYRIAPRYGTNRDMYRLFRTAHKKGIRVCLDLVPGHTSIQHPWFKASCQHKRNNFSDRYIWTNMVWDKGTPPLSFVNGYAQRDGCYATNFFYSQPALNFGFAKPDPFAAWQQRVDDPGPKAMRKELINIMDFWLGKGADGFRVDMASSLVKNDPDKKENIKLWREVRAWLSKAYPQAALISEWGNPKQAISAGYHVDFMLPFEAPGYGSLFFKSKNRNCFFDSRGGGTITTFLNEYQGHSAAAKKGYISVVSGNHDMPRLNYHRSKRDLEVALAFLLTWPGIPFIYYGDEIGMSYISGLASKEGGYARTGSRTPMQWDSGKNAGFSTAAKSKLYLPIDSRKTSPTVEGQANKPGSLLNHVRSLIEIRKNNPALRAKGNVQPLIAKDGKYPFVFLRTKGKQKMLVALNPANEPVQAVLKRADVPELEMVKGRGVKVIAKNKTVKIAMAGVSYGIFEVI